MSVRGVGGPGDLAATLAFGLALLAAVGAGEALRAWAGWRPEASRRFVHATVGVMVALCPPLFERPAGVYALALAFVAVNLVAVPRRLLPGMHGIARASWGTVTFPLALLLALYLCWSLDPARVFALRTAFLVLALADPAASLIGMGLQNPRRYRIGGHEKSLAGTAAFVVTALAASAAALATWGPASWGVREVLAGAVVVAALAATAEALAGGGWDNLAIVGAALVPLAALEAEPGAAGRLVGAVVVAAVFGGAAYRLRALDLSGALAAGLLAWGVVAGGGPAWVLPGLTFFVLSSALSRLGRRRKAAAERLAEKSARRDAGQVVANGGVAALLLAAHVFWPHPALYWGFVGAFAAAAADTWATEIGTLVGGSTRSILTGRPVPAGTSGGVSLAGTLGAVAGAAVVSLAALPFARPFLFDGLTLERAALVVISSGLAGALLDSALGASVQARYRDAGGTLTERPQVGGVGLPLARGWRWVNNDRVNLACTLAGGLFAFLAVSCG